MPWRIVAIGALLSFAFVAGGLFRGTIPVPVDEPVRGYPYRGFAGETVRVSNELTNDTVRQMLPWMQLAREHFFRGELPLWNRHQFSGYPLLANGQSAPFSPFFLATLFVPLPKQIVAMAFLKLLVAFVFTYLFLRDDGRSDGAALFGAVVFTFSVFQTVYLYYPMTAVTSLLPVLLWSLRRSATIFCLVLVAAIAGGHPESVVHLAIAALLLLLIDRVWNPRIAIAALLAVAISTIAWLPVLEQVLLSRRLSEITDATSFPLTSLWAALNPNGFGNPARGTWNWILNYSMVAPTYVGLLALALSASALASRNRRALLLLGASALLFLIAMNWTFLGHALNALPPLSVIANDRLRFVIVFFLCAAGAQMLDRPNVIAFAVAAVALLGASGVVYVKLAGKTLTARDSIGILMLLAFVVVAAVRRRFIPHAAFICATVELFAFNVEFNAPAPQRYYRMRLPIVEALHRIAPDEPYRIVGFDWVFTPNAAAQYGLEDIRGSDPMAFGPYVEFFRRLEAKDSTDVKRVQDVSRPELHFLNVRYLLTEPGFSAPDGWVRRYAGKDGELYESATFVRRFFANATIGPIRQNRSGTEFRFAIDSAIPVSVSSSQPFTPGWEVRVDGRRVRAHRVSGAFIGFPAPAGRSEVIVRYRPRTVRIGLWVSALAAVVAAMVRFAPHVR